MKLRNTYYFGFDLENVQEVQEYLMSEYKEEKDYEVFIAQGDDIMNAFSVINPELNKNKTLINLISYCDGQGFFEED
jgi:hypothetical protein